MTSPPIRGHDEGTHLTVAPPEGLAGGRRRRGRPDFQLLTHGVVIVVAAVLPSLALMRLPLQGEDEGLLLTHPLLVGHGALPHRDFATVYGPLGFDVLEATYRVMGPGLVAERTVGIFYHLVTALAVWVFLLRMSRTVALTAALAAATVLMTIQPVAFAWLGGLAATLVGLAVIRVSATRVALFVGGVSVGLASAYRLELVLFAVAALPLLRSAPRRLTIALGVAAGSSIGLLHAVRTLAPLSTIYLARATSDTRGELSEVSALTWALVATLVVAVGAASVLVLRRQASVETQTLLILTVFSAAMVWQRTDWLHAAFAACVGLPLLVVAGAQCLMSRTTRAGEVVITTAARWRRAVVTLSLVASATMAFLAFPMTGVVVENDGRWLYLRPGEVDETRDAIAAVRDAAKPGSTIFIGAQVLREPVMPPTWLTFLLPNHASSQYFQEWVWGMTEQDAPQTIRDLQAADVLLLRDLSAQGRGLVPHVPDGPPTADRFLAANFCIVARPRNYWVLVHVPAGRPGLPVSSTPTDC